MDPWIKLPAALKPRVMLWAAAGYTDMCEIDKAQSIPELEKVLCRVFQVGTEPEPRRAVLLALHVQTVQFCRRSGFSPEQTSALLSIIKCMHQANTEAALDTAEQCFDYCSELLLCHAVRRPPFTIDLFKLHEVTLILEHVNDTYIRNYALYKYIFTPQVRLDLTVTYDGMSERDDNPGEKPTSPEKESGGTEVAEPQPVGSQEPCTENQETPPQNDGPAQAAPGPGRSALSQEIQEALMQEVLRVSSLPDQSLKSESSEQLSSRQHSRPQGKL